MSVTTSRGLVIGIGNESRCDDADLSEPLKKAVEPAVQAVIGLIDA